MPEQLITAFDVDDLVTSPKSQTQNISPQGLFGWTYYAAGASVGIAEGVYRGLTKDRALAAAFAASQARTEQLELELESLNALHNDSQQTSTLLVSHLEAEKQDLIAGLRAKEQQLQSVHVELAEVQAAKTSIQSRSDRLEQELSKLQVVYHEESINSKERIEAQQISIFELQHEQQKQGVVERDLRRSLSSMWHSTVSLSLQLHHRDQAVQALEAQLAASKAATDAAESRCTQMAERLEAMAAQAEQQALAATEEKAKLRQDAEKLEHANKEAAKQVSSLKKILEEEKGVNAALVQKEETLKKDLEDLERSSKEAVQREGKLEQRLQEVQDANKALMKKEESLKNDLEGMRLGKTESMQREASLQESLREAQELNKALAQRASEDAELHLKASSSGHQNTEEDVTKSSTAVDGPHGVADTVSSAAEPSTSEQSSGASSSSSSSCDSHSSNVAPPATPGLPPSCAVCPSDTQSSSSDSPEKRADSGGNTKHVPEAEAVHRMVLDSSSHSSTASHHSQDAENQRDNQSMQDAEGQGNDHSMQDAGGQGNKQSMQEDDCLEDFLLAKLLPCVLPQRPAPDEMEGQIPNIYPVRQLASPGWHHQSLAVLEHYGLPWKRSWELLPAFYDPEGDMFTMRMQSLGKIGKACFGTVHYAQKWVGPAPAYDGREGWETGYIPVAVKVVRNDDDGQREMRNLSSVTEAMAQQPGPCHVVKFQGAFPHHDEATQTDNLYIATSYVEGSDMQQAFDSLYNILVPSTEGDTLKQQEGERMYIAAVKEAFRQMLKGLEVMHSCGLAHLDLKLNNVRVRTTTTGSKLHVTIIDLGSSQDKPVDCNEVMGNIGYFSPEAIDLFGEPEQRLVSTPSDMWTVGCLLLEVLVGEPAFMDRRMIPKPFEEQADHIKQRQRQWAEDCKGGAQVPWGLQDLEQMVADSSELQLLKDLLQQVLQIEASQRLTASQALSHAYFSTC